MKTQMYKHIISLGGNCDVATNLRHIGARHRSYVFDWFWNADRGLYAVADIIDDDFKCLADLKKFSYAQHYMWPDKNQYAINRHYPYIALIHNDVLKSPDEYKKLLRRIRRMRRIIRGRGRILFVYYRYQNTILSGDISSDFSELMSDEIKRFTTVMHKKHPRLRFDILALGGFARNDVNRAVMPKNYNYGDVNIMFDKVPVRVDNNPRYSEYWEQMWTSVLNKYVMPPKKHKFSIFQIQLSSQGYIRVKFLGFCVAKVPLLNLQKSLIHPPYYNPITPLPPDEHKIFNADGKPMRTFFIRDRHLAHCPTNESKYFIWDRFNIGLNTHFYSHEAMLETMGNPEHRYGMLIESESIVPEDYKIFDKHPELAKRFDLIFTYSEELLNKLPNARFVPFIANIDGDPAAPDCYKHKTKNISMLTSGKCLCDMHRFRLELARKCRDNSLCDTYGEFDGGERVSQMADTYRDYRFCICIENDIKPYHFTERFITALANQCIPIYLGATKIGKFFNLDGIIQITPETDIKEVLKRCTAEEYKRRQAAVLDNYKRALMYKNPFDFMYEAYIVSDSKGVLK